MMTSAIDKAQNTIGIRLLWLPIVVLLLVGTFSSWPVLSAAEAPYAVFEFMKIEPGKNADYRKMEREIWMPIHRERVSKGLIKSWSLWGMRYPGGTAREYDAIAITTFGKFVDVENSYPGEVYKKVHPKMTEEERN